MASATKQALEAALLDLLNTTTLDKITIKDIVERAQVSRQTFYYHFSDIYELVDWSFQDAVKRLGEAPVQDQRARMVLAVETLREQRNLVMNVYHSLGRERLMQGLERVIRPIVEGNAQEMLAEVSGKESSREFVISFLVHGIIGSIIQWLNDGMPENIYEIINDLHERIHPGNGALIAQDMPKE